MRVCSWSRSGGRGVPLPEPFDRAEQKQRRLMSVAAIHAVDAVRKAVACWEGDRSDVGLFLGVGASAGDIEPLEQILESGVDRCHPLYAFQLMNNYTLCHPAILLGIGGPNSALFSRGTATVFALVEALAALQDGSCTRCVVAGADAMAHPVTVAKGRIEDAANAAAALCLTRDTGPVEVVHAGLGLRELHADQRITGAEITREAGRIGAAEPALGWVLACEALVAGAGSVEIRTEDPDGQIAQVLLRRADG